MGADVAGPRLPFDSVVIFGLTWRQLAARALVALAALLLLIQLVPYGRDHNNPPVTRAAMWPDAQAQALADQSCYDCHSNLTGWRWYSNLAPASWLVQRDVEEGRRILDFSEWDRRQPDLDQVQEAISEGGMPPIKYTLPHPSTKLSSDEKARLIAGLAALYEQDPPGP